MRKAKKTEYEADVAYVAEGDEWLKTVLVRARNRPRDELFRTDDPDEAELRCAALGIDADFSRAEWLWPA